MGLKLSYLRARSSRPCLLELCVRVIVLQYVRNVTNDAETAAILAPSVLRIWGRKRKREEGSRGKGQR